MFNTVDVRFEEYADSKKMTLSDDGHRFNVIN